MTNYKNFEELESWQKARELTQKIYQISSTGTFAQDLILSSQVKTRATLITVNIEECFKKKNQNQLDFLAEAQTKANELKTLLYEVLKLGYISLENFKFLGILIGEVDSLIEGLTNYLRATKLKSAA